MLGQLVGGFVVILVGVTLVPPVADGIAGALSANSTGAAGNSSISGASATILGLTTLFFSLAVASVGIAVASQGLRAAGMLGI